MINKTAILDELRVMELRGDVPQKMTDAISYQEQRNKTKLTRVWLIDLCVRHGLWHDVQERVALKRALRAKGVKVDPQTHCGELTWLGIENRVNFEALDIS